MPRWPRAHVRSSRSRQASAKLRRRAVVASRRSSNGSARPAPCSSGRTASASTTRLPSSTSPRATSSRARSGRLAERQPGDRALAACLGGRPGDLPLRLAREPGRPRGRRARHGARGARRDARDCRLPRGLPRRPRLRARRDGGREAGAPARGRRERCGHPGGAVPHGSPGQRLGGRGRCGQGGGDPPGEHSARVRRSGPAPARREPSPGAPGRDRLRWGRLGGHRGRPCLGCGARASAALTRAFGAPGRRDAADGVDHESRRLRRRRRAGPALVRTRATPAARVGRGRLGLPDRLPGRLQRDLGRASRARDGGGARARPSRGRCRPPGDRPDDVLAGGPRPGIARGRSRGLSRGRLGGLVAREDH